MNVWKINIVVDVTYDTIRILFIGFLVNIAERYTRLILKEKRNYWLGKYILLVNVGKYFSEYLGLIII